MTEDTAAVLAGLVEEMTNLAMGHDDDWRAGGAPESWRVAVGVRQARDLVEAAQKRQAATGARAAGGDSLDSLAVPHGPQCATARMFCTWLVSLDEPENVLAREERRTVTLTQIIERARHIVSSEATSKLLPAAPSSAATDEAIERCAGAAYELERLTGGTPWESVVRRNWAYQQEIYDRWTGIARAVLVAAPPTPSAPGVAELLAECARREAGTGEYAFISCDQIVRLLAPSGADGTEAGT